MDIFLLREKAAALPLRPGVYTMLDARGAIIYVGKAKHLKNRVSSYFQNTDRHTAKVARMVSRVHNFEVIITDTEFEALVLENSLIKHHKPKYNIKLKDDKGYPYIRATLAARYPVFTVVSKPADDGARYFGPYPGRGVAFEVIDIIMETFRLPTCSRKFPRDIGRERPCLNLHLGRCIGVCTGGVPYEEYRGLIEQAVMLLEGHSGPLEQRIRADMERAAEETAYEQAARLRDRLRALERLGQRQKVVAAHVPDTDVLYLYPGLARGCIAVLHYIGGILLGRDIELLDDAVEEEDAQGVMEEFIRQYYERRPMVPREILLSHEVEGTELLSEWLGSVRGRRVRVLTPQRGEKRRLVEMAGENARDEALRATTREERTAKVLTLLQNAAGMESPPVRIEAYDISNTGADDIVGAMVVYIDGKPAKKEYRRFKVHGLDAPDDYAAMEQVLLRRLSHVGEENGRMSDRPDLILMDGGTGHITAALRALAASGISCPVLGMVKDDRHRTRALVSADGRELGLTARPALFSFVGNVQEEVHRFAIEYHRTLRTKRVVGSELANIRGIGPERRRALLRHFKTISRIRDADMDALLVVLPRDAAAAVYAYYHQQETEEHLPQPETAPADE